MKRYLILLAFLSFYPVSNLYSQVEGTTLLAFGGNDSVAFDGAGESYLLPGENCRIVVNFVHGSVEGWVRFSKTFTICGEMDSTLRYKRQQITAEDVLQEGSTIEAGDGAIELIFPDGSIIRIAPHTSYTLPTDFCEQVNNMGRLNFGKVWTGIKKLLGKQKYDHKLDRIPATGRRSDRIDQDAYRTRVTVTGTTYSIETTIVGSDTVDIIRVYEGSVEVSKREYDQASLQKEGDAIAKISDDFAKGKITQKEMLERMQQHSGKVGREVSAMKLPNPLTAGHKCVVGRSIGKPVAIEGNENRWYDDANFGK